MKLFLIFALVAVASADISHLLNKYLPPARNNQGSSNSLSILPVLQQLKQSFSGAQQGSAQQHETIKVIHVSAAPQQSSYSAPTNQYLPPVEQSAPVYQSAPVHQVTVQAPAPAYHQQSAQQVQYVQQQTPQVHYQSAPVQNEPVEIQVHVQHIAPQQVHHVKQPQVQYVQQSAPQAQYVQQPAPQKPTIQIQFVKQPAAQYVQQSAPQTQYVQQSAPQVQYVQQSAPQVQYVQQPAPQVQYVQQSAPQVQYVQQEPQTFAAPSQTFQAPAATFNENSGYSYSAPH